MPTTLRFDGMDEFRQALKHLPEELATKAAAVVIATAQETSAAVRNNYPMGPTGNLKRGVRVIVRSNNKLSARATLVSAAPHAHLIEQITAPVPRQTRQGWNRGTMRATPTDQRVIPRAVRARRSMTEQLIEIVREAGLTVTR